MEVVCEDVSVGMGRVEVCFVSPDDVVVTRVICSGCVVFSLDTDSDCDRVVPIVPIEDLEVVCGSGPVVVGNSTISLDDVVDCDITCLVVHVVTGFGLKHPLTSRLTDTVGIFPSLGNYYSITISH